MSKPTWQKQIINGAEYLAPFDIKTKEFLREFKPNELLRGKPTGTRKARSLVQLKRYWAMCKVVSENTEDPKLATYELVDWNIRHRLKFYDDKKVCISPDGHVQFQVRSIAFRNLKHMEACDFFNRADREMANILGCTLEEMDEGMRL